MQPWMMCELTEGEFRQFADDLEAKNAAMKKAAGQRG